MALRAYLRLRWIHFDAEVGGYVVKLRLVREGIQSDLVRPFLAVPDWATA
ncbi:hypothetical protein [Singulisphaera sp. GP187]|nr:hypothetical protein [Singulisphaera sp. GP187]